MVMELQHKTLYIVTSAARDTQIPVYNFLQYNARYEYMYTEYIHKYDCMKYIAYVCMIVKNKIEGESAGCKQL